MAAFVTFLWIPVEGQIRGRVAGAGEDTFDVVSGATALSALDCDPNLPSDFCVTGTCAGDPSCRAPEIPDLATVTSEINVSRALLDVLELSDCTIQDLNVAVELDHSWVNDLEIVVERAGTETLLLRQGDGFLIARGRSELNTVFDDDLSLPERSHRVVRPATSLSVFDGSSLVGVWRLRIEDQMGLDSGQLVDWGLSFAVNCSEAPDPTTCMEDDTTLCLNENRFRVTASYRTSSGDIGSGRAVELTDDTGYLWFFDRDNVEVVIKVLNACSFADRFWVFAAGLTNVEVDLAVVDTRTGAFTGYRNPLNRAFDPIQDTNGLSTCP